MSTPIEIVREMQLWRRAQGKYGLDDYPPGMPFSPRQYGEALDAVLRDAERLKALEAQNARLRGDLEYAEAERLRLTARRDTLDTQIAALTEKTTRLKEVLVDCHAYLMRRITLLTLNESASDTTQSLARDVSVALDALDDGKAAP